METVCGVCNTVRLNSKHGISFQQLLTLLRREFRKNEFDLRIRTMKHKKLNTEEFYVNAYYDADDDQNHLTPIEVVIHHNFDPNMIWDKQQVTDILVQVFDATVHEYKHQRQSKKRFYKTFWNHYNYLDDPDEIDAYSISIAIELCRTLGKYRALRYMHRFSSISRMKMHESFVSPNLNAYVDMFGTLPNPVIRKLAKKVYVRLQKLDNDCIFV
jgi:hypothetical protein